MEGIMKVTLAVLAVALYFPSIADGQTPTVAPGARIRVTVPDLSLERHVATVVSVRGDSIAVATPTGSYTFGLATITALDVRTGTRRQAVKGAAVGLAIGAVTGAVIGALTYKECVPREFLDCLLASGSRGQEAMVGGAVFGALGLITGAVVGALNTTDRWAAVDLPVRFAVTPTSTGGVGIVLTRSF
jgi:hypothetical protein